MEVVKLDSPYTIFHVVVYKIPLLLDTTSHHRKPTPVIKKAKLKTITIIRFITEGTLEANPLGRYAFQTIPKINTVPGTRIYIYIYTRLPFGGCHSDYEQRRRREGVFLFLVHKFKYAGLGHLKIFPRFL